MISRVDVEQKLTRYHKDEMRKLLDAIETCTNKGDYMLQYWGGTVLIYDVSTDLYLTWFNITHVGRSLTTNINSVGALNRFFDDLMDYIKED